MRQVSKWLSPLPTHAHTINISFLPISFTWTLPQLWEVSLPGIVILPLCRWKTKTRVIDPDFPKAIELPSSRGRIPTQAFRPHVVSSPLLPLAPLRSCCIHGVPWRKRSSLCGPYRRPGGSCPLCFCYKRRLKTYRSRILKAEQWTYMLSAVFWSNYIICNYILPFRHNLCCSISSTSVVFNFTFPSWLNADLAGWRALGGQSKLMVHSPLPPVARVYETFHLLTSIKTLPFPFLVLGLFIYLFIFKANTVFRPLPRRTQLHPKLSDLADSNC